MVMDYRKKKQDHKTRRIEEKNTAPSGEGEKR
jgi:hypothetical protein